MGLLDGYKNMLQDYKTKVVDEVREKVLGEGIENILNPSKGKNGIRAGTANYDKRSLTITILYQFDTDSELDFDEQAWFLDNNLKGSVLGVWGNYSLDGQKLNLEKVLFEEIDFQNPKRVKLKQNQFLITIGKGRNAEANKETKVSYVQPDLKRGYIYQETCTEVTMAHEFGHIFGLSDRYAEVYGAFRIDKESSDSFPEEKVTAYTTKSPNGNPVRLTVPLMLQKLKQGIDTTYNPYNNLMSRSGGTIEAMPPLTHYQLHIVFDNETFEDRYDNALFFAIPRDSYKPNFNIIYDAVDIDFERPAKVIYYINNRKQNVTSHFWYVNNRLQGEQTRGAVGDRMFKYAEWLALVP